MTSTILIPNCEYKTFEDIRKVIHDANPVLIIYESFEKNEKRAIFTFNHPMSIPDELAKYRIRVENPKRIDFSKVKFPSDPLDEKIVESLDKGSVEVEIKTPKIAEKKKTKKKSN